MSLERKEERINIIIIVLLLCLLQLLYLTVPMMEDMKKLNVRKFVIVYFIVP